MFGDTLRQDGKKLSLTFQGDRSWTGEIGRAVYDAVIRGRNAEYADKSRIVDLTIE